MFGAFGGARNATSLTFLSRAGMDSGVADTLDLKSLVAIASGCRQVKKADMVLNDYQPEIEVDPETYVVKADGRVMTCEPATELPMAQRYFLF